MGKIMSEREWYGSAEHFRTEKNYDDYKKGKNRKRKSILGFNKLLK